MASNKDPHEDYVIHKKPRSDGWAVLPAEAPLPEDPNEPHELRELLVDYLRDALVALALKKRGLAEFLLNRAAEIQPDHSDVDLGRRKAKAIRPSPSTVEAICGPGETTVLPENFAIIADKGSAYTVEYFEKCDLSIDPSWLNQGV